MKRILIMMVGIFGLSSANAEENSFFTDPSLMKPWDQGTYDLGYVHPDILQKARRYHSVMVDQPEIHMAVDSKYKGAKGNDLKQLADVARLATIERLEAGGWTVTDEPGPNVVYLHWAISDLYLKKKKRSLMSFTPVGFVVHSTAQATMRDLWKKINIVELGMMIEWLDSTSGEVLSAGTVSQGARKSKGKKADMVSWEQLDALFQTIGEQTRCHLDNNKLAEGKKRQDCDSILIKPAG
jgi:hypothetical protein